MTTDFLEYFMEDSSEVERLERKTDPDVVLSQARWAGLSPGMRVADIGCGPGVTSSQLLSVVSPGGEVVGVDNSTDRIAYAAKGYAAPGLTFVQRNYFDDLRDLGTFDFIWVRFVLEFHRSRALELVHNLNRVLRPGGTLFLIDLDYNCLSHSGLPDRVEKTITEVVGGLEKNADFDPFAGRRLYGHLYDLGYANIKVDLTSHHLIYGELPEMERYNWERKVMVAAKRSGCDFSQYSDGFDGFAREFAETFKDPRRFTYTPVVLCRGTKPV